EARAGWGGSTSHDRSRGRSSAFGLQRRVPRAVMRHAHPKACGFRDAHHKQEAGAGRAGSTSHDRSSASGVAGRPSRTKIGGAKVGTVGGAFSAVHGNEPGTLKEIVSLTTGGPAPILSGAPTVLIEKGMAGITGSPLMANRGAGPSGRTA